MLKNNYIDYFGTDIHRSSSTFVIDNFDRIESEIIKIIGIESYNQIKRNSDNLVQ